MRAILIDPYTKNVTERAIMDDQRVFNNLVGGFPDTHQALNEPPEGHVYLVAKNAVRKRRKTWFFNNVLIWGPMLILGKEKSGFTSASLDVATVAGMVRWQGQLDK
jgi:hypothetical protein